jgi:dihydroxy-acid dehydratase
MASVVGHVQALMEGGIALVKNGDIITIDAVKNTINLKISDEEFASKKASEF